MRPGVESAGRKSQIDMIKKALEKVMSEDMSEIWTVLNNEEKRRIIDSFVIHNFKKNQMIYAEGEELSLIHI